MVEIRQSLTSFVRDGSTTNEATCRRNQSTQRVESPKTDHVTFVSIRFLIDRGNKMETCVHSQTWKTRRAQKIAVHQMRHTEASGARGKDIRRRTRCTRSSPAPSTNRQGCASEKTATRRHLQQNINACFSQIRDPRQRIQMSRSEG